MLSSSLTLRSAASAPYCFALLAALVAAGCGGSTGPARYAVSGAINLEGQPMQRGSIQFVSTSSEQGAMAVGKIENGKYSIPADAGPSIGKHKVRILADDEVPFALDDPRAHKEASEAQRKAATTNSIDPKYNDATTLEATVTAAGPNEFSFNVEKRKAEDPTKKGPPRGPDF